MTDYITSEDTIIFSPEYDKPLNPELISNYKKIIFSNYELNDKLFEAYESNNGEHYTQKFTVMLYIHD